jgi:hypothetical protein
VSNLLVYDPRYHTFESWACLMCELYATNNLEIPNKDTDWKAWGDGLSAIGSFNQEGVPMTDEFDDWQDWAAAVMNAVSQINNQ